MPYSPLGFFAGFGIARSTDPALEGSQAAKVAVIPGILGLNIASLLIAKVVADQEVESLQPPVPQNPAIAVAPLSYGYPNVNVGSSACKIFVVSNTGTATLEVTETTLSGTNAGEFPIVSGEIVSGGTPVEVPPGATHFVEVSFKPLAGDVVTRAASLDSASTDQPIVKIELNGTTDSAGPTGLKKP